MSTLNLEQSLVCLNEVQKSIKRKSKLSPFDYYIWGELIKVYIAKDQIIYIKDFVNYISKKTIISKTKIMTSLKKLNHIGLINKHRSEIDERCMCLTIDKHQYDLYKNLENSVSKQLNKLNYGKEQLNETL
ncbi:staphylococcal accessory regulator family [Staphylococcus xylosus]|uniref:transcriptional regulator, SarA/Rot family n=1 Tax=Staphylococcus xylosus TaxID=1288 RepID=UPI00085C5F05|nr:hypothetical protein [Staphylococcus xylosus]SCU37104.1 staphylococcal accessory regulator family [Staphylococcus xylosus]